MKAANSLLPLLHAYFHDWMAGQRSASRHTILSYRDTWRLFLRFVAERNQRDVAQLTLPDLSDKQVLAFLDHLEKTCRRSITTRNCRLAALHSFFRFLADRDPLTAGQGAAILRIPNKRAPKRTAAYLEMEELEILMNQPDRKTKLGERDHVLLALIYNSGARISETLRVRRSDIRLDPPAQTFMRKPTWRQNDRPSKKPMAYSGQGLHPPGGETPICWHGSIPCEPAPHRQPSFPPMRQ